MKKAFLTLFVLVIFICILVGCKPVDIKPSSSQLDVCGNLNSFNEAEQKVQMEVKKDILFAQNENSEYYVLVADNLGEDTKQSCKEMSEILNKMIGSTGKFEVASSRANGGKFISIGDTNEALNQNFDKSAILYDGFIIKTDNLYNIYIIANEENGLSNGIYTMLEDVFGCMFVRDDFDYIPRYNTIYLDKLDILNNPDFEWRKIFQHEVSQNHWYKKLKNNGASAEGVEVNTGWGTWCHSVFTFVDPKIYAEDHPEYFVFVDGEPRQLCLSNPDIYPIVEAKMAELIAKQPDKKYWDFSLNDNNDYCKCKNCAKVLEDTGSMMGTMLPILNKLAKRFPDKMISTLAYFHNKQVPSGIKCEDNVNIVVAPIATGQLYTCKNGDTKKAKEAQRLISDWGKVAKSVFVWDYVVDFSHLLLPYPNFDVQKDNHDFYIANNVKAIFHQGSREHTDELACLRSYVLSRQVWDNTVDIDKIIAKYLKVTYGDAAPYLAEYLDTMNNELRTKARDLDLYDSSSAHATDYLSNKNIDRYIQLVDHAMMAEKDNADITARLEEIKVNVLYAKMTANGLNIIEKQVAFDEFKVLVQKLGIDKYNEWAEMDDFITAVYPKMLVNIKFAISTIAILPVVLACIVAGVLIILNKKRAKSSNIQ